MSGFSKKEANLIFISSKSYEITPEHGFMIDTEFEFQIANLIATKKIKKGEKLSIYNMESKRPNLGISPIFFWKILGKRVTKNYLEDEFINEKI